MRLCQWNPTEDAPATVGKDHLGREVHEGCQNVATCETVKGVWLCDGCAFKLEGEPVENCPACGAVVFPGGSAMSQNRHTGQWVRHCITCPPYNPNATA